MEPVDTVAHLGLLAVAAGSPHRLADALDALLALAGRVVPSALGLSLTVDRAGLPVTVTALTLAAGLDPVRASLAVRLPARDGRRSGNSGALLVLYAGAAGVFAQPAVDLPALLDLDPHRVSLDEHLDLPALAGAADVLGDQLDDVSAVDRALGILLDRGLLPGEGRTELNRLAAEAGVGVSEAARRLVGSVTGQP